MARRLAGDVCLGGNWDPAKGGYQTLPTASFADFPGDEDSAAWLANAAYAADWQAFHGDGEVARRGAS